MESNSNNKKLKIIIYIIIALIIFLNIFILLYKSKKKEEKLKTTNVNLSTLSYDDGTNLKVYTQDDFNTFYEDYKNNNLSDIYVTKFLFDGVGMYKEYDLDDFTQNGKDYEAKVLEANVVNINTAGNIILSGELTGMIAVDTNNKKADTNIVLNGVKIDTDSNKIPAIYVYNKDITYTESKVTIKTNEGTKNYIEGGNLKKISLIPSDDLNSYASKYNGYNLINYNAYNNYYGVYKSNEIDNVLFAKITADNEDLNNGDPYYYYKASGAISSDIDLYFEGKGYLEVTSKNKEGIESKGNLELLGGTGDYVVNAEDDCLNTTTDKTENKNARNSITIDVNSLYAKVSMDADEGDGIDSNGTLTINNGTIVTIARPGADSGIDSEDDIHINGGMIISTGDMYDQISNESKQNFIVLSFNDMPIENTIITLLDSNDNVVMSYKSDRTYSNLIYSSSNLKEGTYYLFKDGEVTGSLNNGYYSNVTSYVKGIKLGYVSTESMNNRKQMPNDNSNMTPPNRDSGMALEEQLSTNSEFKISGVSNMFSGIRELVTE